MDTSISLDRMIRRAKEVLSFNTRTYDEITRDPGATMEAALIVAIVAISSGLGWLFAGPGALIGAVLGMLIGWVVSAAIIYFVGTRLTATPATSSSVERVLRVVGYAAVPNVFQFLTGIWLLGGIISSGLWLWTLGTMILAIRAALGMSVGRSVATGFIAWIASIFVLFVLGAIFGIDPRLPF